MQNLVDLLLKDLKQLNSGRLVSRLSSNKKRNICAMTKRRILAL